MAQNTTRRAVLGGAVLAGVVPPVAQVEPSASRLTPALERCLAGHRWINAAGLSDDELDAAADELDVLNDAVIRAPILTPADIAPKLRLLLELEREGPAAGTMPSEEVFNQILAFLGLSMDAART